MHNKVGARAILKSGCKETELSSPTPLKTASQDCTSVNIPHLQTLDCALGV